MFTTYNGLKSVVIKCSEPTALHLQGQADEGFFKKMIDHRKKEIVVELPDGLLDVYLT